MDITCGFPTLEAKTYLVSTTVTVGGHRSGDIKIEEFGNRETEDTQVA
jgi:hypothetical protein